MLITNVLRLKDSDVTWLYGPLHTASVEPVRAPKVASTDERLGIDRPNPAAKKKATKPILKHRTISEMLATSMPSSPVLESAVGEPVPATVASVSDRPKLPQTKSDTNVLQSQGVMPRNKSPPRHPNLREELPIDSPLSPSESQHSTNKKHISFNTFVEQCVAIEDPSQVPPQENKGPEVLEMKPSSHERRESHGSRPSLSRQSSSTSSAERLTISMLAPTTLKPGPGTNPDLQMVYVPLLSTSLLIVTTNVTRTTSLLQRLIQGQDWKTVRGNMDRAITLVLVARPKRRERASLYLDVTVLPCSLKGNLLVLSKARLSPLLFILQLHLLFQRIFLTSTWPWDSQDAKS